MKVAIFSDIHGNAHALAAILADIERQKVDQVVFAGDAVNPFPGSRWVWQTIRDLQIPMIRGNHEDYMVTVHDTSIETPLRHSVQFWPIRAAAAKLSPEMVAEMAALPISLTVPGPKGDDLFVCHASPFSNRHSFYNGVDDQMAESLTGIAARTIVGGHCHVQWQQAWRQKLLLLCGSVGLPLNGDASAQYLILIQQNGAWQPIHRRMPYDHEAALRALRESAFLAKGGPIAWVFYDELWQADYRLVPFLRGIDAAAPPSTLREWQQAAKNYLESIDRWRAIAPLVSGDLLVGDIGAEE